jgi:predicted O-methyltransferase YrrM
MKIQIFKKYLVALLLLIFITGPCYGQKGEQSAVDKKVSAFLESHNRWHDMNVPSSDGKLLYDLIIENNYTQALEIGTSTGHSTIWMAWALSKTGGKLITIEINETRHREALKNFRDAGVDGIIDARLANAHDLVPALRGPFDFVFSDADKSWYRRYFDAVDPKMPVGGCFATHNVSDRPGSRWNRDYLDYLLSLDHFETTVDNRGSGMAISYKRAEK